MHSSIGCLAGGYNPVGIIDAAMFLIAQNLLATLDPTTCFGIRWTELCSGLAEPLIRDRYVAVILKCLVGLLGQYSKGRLERINRGIGTNQTRVDVDNLAGNQACFDALAENIPKEGPKQVHAPATASLAQDAVIRQVAVEVVFTESQPIQSLGQPTHEFTFRRNVFEEKDEHKLEQDDGIDRGVATSPVAFGDRWPNEGEVDDLTNPAQRLV